MKKSLLSLMLLSFVAFGEETKPSHGLIHAAEIIIEEKEYVVGGLKTLKNYNFNYEIRSHETGGSEAWVKVGEISRPGRVEPILFKVEGVLYMAGGWMGTKSFDGRVVWLPLKSIWRIYPGAPIKILETEQPIGNATLKQEGSKLTFTKMPRVTELFNLKAVLNKTYPKSSNTISVTIP